MTIRTFIISAVLCMTFWMLSIEFVWVLSQIRREGIVGEEIEP